MAPSRTQVDKAGRLLRDWWRTPNGEAQFDDDELTDAVGVIVEYRSGFQDPLKKVTVGLRQFVERESSEVIVGQRLKRNPQILNKLGRFSSMRLTQMEDIAGCRAILPGGASEVSGVLKRIRRNWEVLRVEDYVAAPEKHWLQSYPCCRASRWPSSRDSVENSFPTRMGGGGGALGGSYPICFEGRRGAA